MLLSQHKQAIFKYFKVENLAALKKSERFRTMNDDLRTFDFRLKTTWQVLYRRFIGTIPGEEHLVGYGCINGVNIFKYFKPWQVFELDSKTATKADIKTAHRRLAKVYHPDNLETGDRAVFEKLEVMYRSIIAIYP